MARREHDRLTRWAFGQPDEARDLFRAFLPAEVANEIDWPTLRPASDRLIDQQLKLLRPDLVFEVQWWGERAYLFVVLEHRSTPLPRMGFRMLDVTVRVLEQWIRLNPGTGALPRVLPVVLYHGQRRWNEPLDVCELFGVGPARRPGAVLGLPSMCYHLIDLGDLGDDEVRQLSLSALGRLTLLLLKHGRTHPDATTWLLESAGLLRALNRASSGSDALVRLMHYLLQVNADIEADQLVSTLEEQVNQEVAMAAKTAGDRLRAKGREEGRGEGRIEGQRQVLRTLLNQKFGPLDPHTLDRIDRADPMSLRRWALRVLTETTLENVLGNE